MERVNTNGSTDETPEDDFYLPATATLSNAPGRVERFLKTLFRQRGELRVRFR